MKKGRIQKEEEKVSKDSKVIKNMSKAKLVKVKVK